MTHKKWTPRVVRAQADDHDAFLARAEELTREADTAFAHEQLAHWSPKGILNDSNEEFVERITNAITGMRHRTRTDTRALLVNLRDNGPLINLFGYGKVREVLTEFNLNTHEREPFGWIWGHEAAAALGWDQAQFVKWCDLQRNFDLSTQRDMDEERGTLGWECFQHIPMRVSVWLGDGTSAEHSDESGCMRGPIMRYWDDIYLIHTSRIMPLMSSSPWAKEWLESVTPLLGHGFGKAFGAKAAEVKSYQRQENSLGEVEVVETGRTLADMFAEERQGYTEQEAIDRAMRGPVPPKDLGGDRG